MSNEDIIVKIDPIIAPLVPDFMNNRKQDVIKLTQAVNDQDFESIRITGHNLKGCGAGYGFQQITDIGAEIEQAAVTTEKDRISLLIDELDSYLKKVKIEHD